jgi:hypothetical protein
MFTRAKTETLDRLKHLRVRCSDAHEARGPRTGSYPNLDKLRHLYADALQLNVVFQPRKGWFPVKEKDGKRHLKSCTSRRHYVCDCKSTKSIAFLWQDNPVWGHAPNGALQKRERFCSLLHTIVENGHLIDLSHDLMRLAITFWQSSLRNFHRLCRRIVARIATALHSRETTIPESPEPKQTCGSLSLNPAIRRANWDHTQRPFHRREKHYVPRYVPPFKRGRFYSKIGDNLKNLIGSVAWPPVVKPQIV